MSQGDDRRWPFLSPSREGWTWISGARGHVRRFLVNDAVETGPRRDRTIIVLDVLEGLDHVMRDMNDDVALLVSEAYRRGASWNDIALRLGRSKQTVHQRFQSRVQAKRTEELLLSDLAQAEQRARYICHHGTDVDEINRARGFLRQLPR